MVRLLNSHLQTKVRIHIQKKLKLRIYLTSFLISIYVIICNFHLRLVLSFFLIFPLPKQNFPSMLKWTYTVYFQSTSCRVHNAICLEQKRPDTQIQLGFYYYLNDEIMILEQVRKGRRKRTMILLKVIGGSSCKV